MTKCSIKSCTRRKNCKERNLQDGISFHKFPKNSPTRKHWVDACDQRGFRPSSSSVICSIHFDANEFKQTPDGPILSPVAIPTLFLPNKHIEKLCQNRKKRIPIHESERFFTTDQKFNDLFQTSSSCQFVLDPAEILRVSKRIAKSTKTEADEILNVVVIHTFEHLKNVTYLNHEYLIKKNLRNGESCGMYPVTYKCDPCLKFWWHLAEFREHLLQHDNLNIKNEIINGRETFIAYEDKNSDEDEEPDTNCPRCGHDLTLLQANTKLHCPKCIRHIRQDGDRKEIKKEHFSNFLVKSDHPKNDCEICQSNNPDQERVDRIYCRYCSRHHFLNTKEPRTFFCEQCNMWLPYQCMKYEHMLSHTKEYTIVQKCTLCKDFRVLISSEGSELHRIVHHDDVKSAKSLFCDVILPKSCINLKCRRAFDDKTYENQNKMAESEEEKSNEEDMEIETLDECFDHDLDEQMDYEIKDTDFNIIIVADEDESDVEIFNEEHDEKKPYLESVITFNKRLKKCDKNTITKEDQLMNLEHKSEVETPNKEIDEIKLFLKTEIDLNPPSTRGDQNIIPEQEQLKNLLKAEEPDEEFYDENPKPGINLKELAIKEDKNEQIEKDQIPQVETLNEVKYDKKQLPGTVTSKELAKTVNNNIILQETQLMNFNENLKPGSKLNETLTKVEIEVDNNENKPQGEIPSENDKKQILETGTDLHVDDTIEIEVNIMKKMSRDYIVYEKTFKETPEPGIVLNEQLETADSDPQIEFESTENLSQIKTLCEEIYKEKHIQETEIILNEPETNEGKHLQIETDIISEVEVHHEEISDDRETVINFNETSKDTKQIKLNNIENISQLKIPFEEIYDDNQLSETENEIDVDNTEEIELDILENKSQTEIIDEGIYCETPETETDDLNELSETEDSDEHIEFEIIENTSKMEIPCEKIYDNSQYQETEIVLNETSTKDYSDRQLGTGNISQEEPCEEIYYESQDTGINLNQLSPKRYYNIIPDEDKLVNSIENSKSVIMLNETATHDNVQSETCNMEHLLQEEIPDEYMYDENQFPEPEIVLYEQPTTADDDIEAEFDNIENMPQVQKPYEEMNDNSQYPESEILLNETLNTVDYTTEMESDIVEKNTQDEVIDKETYNETGIELNEPSIAEDNQLDEESDINNMMDMELEEDINTILIDKNNPQTEDNLNELSNDQTELTINDDSSQEPEHFVDDIIILNFNTNEKGEVINEEEETSITEGAVAVAEAEVIQEEKEEDDIIIEEENDEETSITEGAVVAEAEVIQEEKEEDDIIIEEENDEETSITEGAVVAVAEAEVIQKAKEEDDIIIEEENDEVIAILHHYEVPTENTAAAKESKTILIKIKTEAIIIEYEDKELEDCLEINRSCGQCKNTDDEELLEACTICRFNLATYKCKRCDLTCKSIQDYSEHMYNEYQFYVCSECPIHFFNLEILVKHLEQHDSCGNNESKTYKVKRNQLKVKLCKRFLPTLFEKWASRTKFIQIPNHLDAANNNNDDGVVREDSRKIIIQILRWINELNGIDNQYPIEIDYRMHMIDHFLTTANIDFNKQEYECNLCDTECVTGQDFMLHMMQHADLIIKFVKSSDFIAVQCKICEKFAPLEKEDMKTAESGSEDQSGDTELQNINEQELPLDSNYGCEVEVTTTDPEESCEDEENTDVINNERTEDIAEKITDGIEDEMFPSIFDFETLDGGDFNDYVLPAWCSDELDTENNFENQTPQLLDPDDPMLFIVDGLRRNEEAKGMGHSPSTVDETDLYSDDSMDKMDYDDDSTDSNDSTSLSSNSLSIGSASPALNMSDQAESDVQIESDVQTECEDQSEEEENADAIETLEDTIEKLQPNKRKYPFRKSPQPSYSMENEQLNFPQEIESDNQFKRVTRSRMMNVVRPKPIQKQRVYKQYSPGNRSPKASPCTRKCRGNTSCKLFSEELRMKICKHFWSLPKEKRDIFLLTFVRKDSSNTKNFFLRLDGADLRVCRAFFLATLCISITTVDRTLGQRNNY